MYINAAWSGISIERLILIGLLEMGLCRKGGRLKIRSDARVAADDKAIDRGTIDKTQTFYGILILMPHSRGSDMHR